MKTVIFILKKVLLSYKYIFGKIDIPAKILILNFIPKFSALINKVKKFSIF